ncbi:MULTISPECIES: hypothetical protein [Prauserella salsuginis group]|uniref:Uncharacterized protein n=1 Tax=Prauserella salsuginis TaxID=387889 RepID=A0ABW6G855_9PSEU|nr:MULTISPECIES: hypothetical protein [Prauserella salsuginis group]MCR3721758.1 hypothetical protein [Prauserella flava]MCR3734449.1 hypothetical protein [Prauserella salsuginis]
MDNDGCGDGENVRMREAINRADDEAQLAQVGCSARPDYPTSTPERMHRMRHGSIPAALIYRPATIGRDRAVTERLDKVVQGRR